MKSIAELTDEQKTVYIIATSYERCRRESGQRGYKVFDDPNRVDVNSKVWKTFATVYEWLKKTGWTLSWKTTHWQGYIGYVFSNTKPGVPMPGQLKNQMLFRQYLTHCPKKEAVSVRTPEEMESIYRKVLRPEIAESTIFMEIIGVKRSYP
jgi:hypothetical protein